MGIKTLKHDYKIQGDTAIVFIDNEDLEQQFTIDTKNLLKVLKYKWWITDKGYVKNSTVGFLHRYLLNPPLDFIVDHISHNKLNNKEENLRICTQSENQQNRIGAARHHTLGIRGVTFCRKTSMFRARVTIDGQKFNIGEFYTPDEAKAAIIKKRRELSEFSEMDKINPSQEFLDQSIKNEIMQNQSKIRLPEKTYMCCRHNNSTNDYDTYLNFSCFLHYPTKTHANNKAGIPIKVKFQLTYWLKCPKNDCNICFIYSYDNKNKLINSEKTTGKKSKEHLLCTSKLFIKNIDLPVPCINTYEKTSKSNWFFGIYIDDGLFESFSLDKSISRGQVLTKKMSVIKI